MMQSVMRYSEAFKLHVVRELEEGRYESPGKAGRAYGVKGQGTVACWLRRRCAPSSRDVAACGVANAHGVCREPGYG
jgi:transposase-like protein